MISKELLSEVLNLKRIDSIYIEDNMLYFCELNKPINIYELEHKCISWALDQGYQFRIYIDKIGKVYEIGKIGYGWNLFSSDSVIKSCQWILENKDE